MLLSCPVMDAVVMNAINVHRWVIMFVFDEVSQDIAWLSSWLPDLLL